MVRNSVLTEDELKLLKKIGANYDFSKQLNDDDGIELEEMVGDYLVRCLDGKGKVVNPEAEICYSILDKIDDI